MTEWGIRNTITGCDLRVQSQAHARALVAEFPGYVLLRRRPSEWEEVHDVPAQPPVAEPATARAREPWYYFDDA